MGEREKREPSLIFVGAMRNEMKNIGKIRITTLKEEALWRF